jgi:hypothetical protein
MNTAGKKDYGQTLIAMTGGSKNPRAILSTTLCEEKKDSKERLTSIMKNRSYKRISLLLSAMLLIAILCTACALGASGGSSPDTQKGSIDTNNALAVNPPQNDIHFFVTDETLEYDKEQLAIYLFSQRLELGKQGKLMTSSDDDIGNRNKLADYMIHNVDVFSLDIDTPDTFRFTASYSVLPEDKTQSGWTAGNGVPRRDGWIINKLGFIEFKKEDNGYRFISENTGL